MSPLNRKELAAIFIGGALGALARVALTRLAPTPVGHWPWMVWAINLAGAFILGYVVTHVRWHGAHPLVRPLLGPGFCGGFTTFATLQLELLQMLESHRYGLAVGYAAASIVLGALALEAGALAVRRLAFAAGIPEPIPLPEAEG